MKDVSSKKERDKSVLLDVVRRFGPLSRVDIHDMTKLRPGTISTLVRELLREGALIEGGPSNNPMGRKQVLLHLNEDYASIAAVEFDAETVVAAVFNLGGRIRHLISEPADLEHGSAGLVRQLLRCAEAAISQSGVDRRTLDGIGIAEPGLIDNEFRQDVPLCEQFENHFGVQVLVENNTRARAVAERMRGAGAMAEDMVYVDYGAAIGMGVISEGRLLRGRGECAGAFGHTHVMDGGPPCKCGSFGCLDALVGAAAIAARARAAVMEGGNSTVLEVAGGDAARITGWHVIEAAHAGDKMCAVIVEDVERYLGLGLANVVNLFNPSLVILDRRLGTGGESFLNQTARVVHRQALERSTRDLEFRYSQLGAEAGVLGVALLMIERHFEIPALKLPVFMTEPSRVKPRKLLKAVSA